MENIKSLHTNYIRDMSFIKNSPEDMIDILLNMILFFLGIFFLGIFFFSYHQTFREIPEHYLLFVNYKLTELNIGILLLTVSSANFVRLFYPYRLKLCLVIFLKTLTLFCMLIIFFNDIYNPPLLSCVVINFSLNLFALRSVLRAK